ncbi:hypothetical protein C8R46DRAFT_145145 [Mycena filopes]|nr:hypothetical protein C8R46DRAFT_145145 [Mycena filopes]
MEYVLVPAKRRKISSDADDELRLPKKSKIAHTPRPAVGLRSLVPTHTGPSRRKHIVLSDNSDSEVEEPLAKKIRSNPRSSKHSGPQTAISVADAVNNAYKQNSKIVIPKTVPRNPSPPPRPLPRRTTKRKADSGTSPILASSSSEANSPPSTGVSSPHVEQARDTRNLSRPIPGPSPPTEVSRNSSTTAPSGLEAQLAQIHAAIASVAATQRRQDAEVRELRQRYERGVEYNMDSVERQSHSTEGTVRIVADLVQGLVSALPFGGGAQGSFTGQPRHGSGSYRGRGRGRGGGAGHHHSTQRFRPREYPPFLGSVQADPPGAYYEQRAWIPGPHAQDHRDERGVRYGERYGEERQEIREGRRERRPTRFSPPISPENGPDLVLPPSRHSRPSRFDGTESDEGEPVANPERPSGSTAASRRQAPVTNNNNPRSEGSSAPRGRPSTRRSPSPQDEQDWETQYAKET